MNVMFKVFLFHAVFVQFDLSFSLFVICSFCNLFCTSVAGYILTTFTCFQNNTLKEIQ